jgi:hypothetical protein
MDFDKNGDMWAVLHRYNSDEDIETWELWHYKMLDEDPYYELVPGDIIDVTDQVKVGTAEQWGLGDMGISFSRHRLFLFSANSADGGSNRITSYDLNQNPPALIKMIDNPYPPLTRHHMMSAAYNRMDIDVDHRDAFGIHEQCRIFAYATIFNSGVDCYVIRLDGDLNVLDEGSIYHPAWPGEFNKVPQNLVLNDGPNGNGDLLGVAWDVTTFFDWPVPADW